MESGLVTWAAHFLCLHTSLNTDKGHWQCLRNKKKKIQKIIKRMATHENNIFIWKSLLIFKRSKWFLLVLVHFREFYGLSTWDFDRHLLDQVSLSKWCGLWINGQICCSHVNVSKHFSKCQWAHCNKQVKLPPPPSCLSFSVLCASLKWPHL